MAAPVFHKFSRLTNRVGIILSRSCTTAESQAATPTIKEPLTKRIVSHLKRIVEDYKMAAIETINVCKEKPVKTSCLVSLTAVTSYFYSHNPTMANYEGCLAAATGDIAEVGEDLRNAEKCRQVQNITYYQAHGRLRRFTLGVCSFIWVSEYPAYVDIYEAHCKEVKLSWTDWYKQIIDVGVLGRWINLEGYMVDFDINPDEWNMPTLEKEAADEHKNKL